MCQLFFALALHHLLLDYMEDPNEPLEKRWLIFEYFGTCSRATLTLFEMTLANWPPVARILQEHVGEWWCVFSIAHKLSIGFAVIGIINGVFMQETFKVAATDDKLLIRETQAATRVHQKKDASAACSRRYVG